MRQPYVHQYVITLLMVIGVLTAVLVEHPQMMSPLAKYHRSKKGMLRAPKNFTARYALDC